jgi:hypothetical protein
MRQGEAVFVDSGTWIALALSRDPLQSQGFKNPGLIARGQQPTPWRNSPVIEGDRAGQMRKRTIPSRPSATG